VTHRASFVLSLCFALATPLGARAQSPAAPAPAAPPPVTAPAAPVDPAAPAPVDPNAPAAPAPAQPPAAAPVDPNAAPAVPVDPSAAPAAPVDPNAAPAAPVDPSAAPAVPVDPAAAPAALDTPPAPVAEPEPAPAPAPAPAPTPQATTPAPAEAKASIDATASAPKPGGAGDKADEARCAQLFAQGQTALAQAEGCAGGENPIYAGSQVSLTQTTAPAYRTMPDNDNGFYGLNLYLAPRFRLTESWALFADVTLGYEATVPDDTMQRHQVQSSDTRIQFSGVLGTLGGVTFITGPRLIVPTSKFSWAGDVVAGLGTSLGAVKNFEVLSGLAVSLTGVYTHIFSRNLTVEPRGRGTDKYECQGSTASETRPAECVAGTLRLTQDQFRVAPSVSLNVNEQWSTGLSYVYGWNLVKRFENDEIVVDTLAGPTVVDDISDNPIDDTRWRRSGSLTASVNYQPAPWLIATLSGNTSVCYSLPSGFQSSMGGCSGGMKSADWSLRNPIANKYSTISLALTVPVDAFIKAVTSNETEQKTAKSKSKPKI
jgi:hypothetical protein